MRRAFSLSLVVLVVLALVQPATAGRRISQVHEVVITGGPVPFLMTYNPDDLTIRKKDRIAWSNATTTLHHVTFYDSPVSDSLHIPAGAAVLKKFKKPGEYLYYCDIRGHAVLVGDECFGMCGGFTVE